MSAPLSPPITYQQALEQAAVLVAAQKAPKPTAEKAVAATATAAEGIIAARDRAAAYAKPAIHQLWAAVNPYDEAAVAEFAAQAARVMSAAQSAASRAAAAGLVLQLAAVGVKASAAHSVPVDVRAPAAAIKNGRLVLQQYAVSVDYAGGSAKVSKADMTTQAVFKRPAAVHRFAKSQGATDFEAAALAGQRIDNLIDDNLMLAQRLAQQQVLVSAAGPVNLDGRRSAKTTIIGYRRVIHPELSRGGTCGMCIVASDRIYTVAELMPIHAHCKCTIAAITEDYDPADDLNAVDLNQLYKDAGGTSAAHLKRTRYKEVEHGELGAVLVPQRKYKPRSKASEKAAAGTGVMAEESKVDVARRQLPLFEANLANLREQGLAEDSSQVKYHKQQIAKYRERLTEDQGSGSTRGSGVSRARTRMNDDTRDHPPVPAADRSGDDGGGPPRNIPPVAGSPDDRYPDMDNGDPAPLRPSDLQPLVDDDLAYILDGDGHGAGGHRAGTGIPGKSELPAGWDEAKLLDAIESILWDLGLDRNITPAKDGVVFRALHDGVILAVPVRDYGRYWEVATAYPLSGDGVHRNDDTGNPVPIPLNLDDLTRRLNS